VSEAGAVAEDAAATSNRLSMLGFRLQGWLCGASDCRARSPSAYPKQLAPGGCPCTSIPTLPIASTSSATRPATAFLLCRRHARAGCGGDEPRRPGTEDDQVVATGRLGVGAADRVDV
jgi:hypothetical protein